VSVSVPVFTSAQLRCCRSYTDSSSSVLCTCGDVLLQYCCTSVGRHVSRRHALLLPRVAGVKSDKVFYYENIEGGHGGAADNKQQAFMNTMYLNFLKDVLHAK
jgi:hypothetical protein